MDLDRVVDRLSRHYGRPLQPPTRDPWIAILRQNVGYLVSDARREEAFRRFTREIGTDPRKILAAPASRLREVIAAPGTLAETFADKLRDSARTLLESHDGDLNAALDRARSPRRTGDDPDGARAGARAVLQEFPGVGAPGADRLMLLSRRAKILPLDSHALRVLVRLGLAKPHDNYATMYRSAQEAIGPVTARSWTWLEHASSLLERHGRELCKKTKPLCAQCPLRQLCPAAKSFLRA